MPLLQLRVATSFVLNITTGGSQRSTFGPPTIPGIAHAIHQVAFLGTRAANIENITYSLSHDQDFQPTGVGVIAAHGDTWLTANGHGMIYFALPHWVAGAQGFGIFNGGGATDQFWAQIFYTSHEVPLMEWAHLKRLTSFGARHLFPGI